MWRFRILPDAAGNGTIIGLLRCNIDGIVMLHRVVTGSYFAGNSTAC
jgi:hypothetical protein